MPFSRTPLAFILLRKSLRLPRDKGLFAIFQGIQSILGFKPAWPYYDWNFESRWDNTGISKNSMLEKSSNDHNF